jgi:hypothetical protein
MADGTTKPIQNIQPGDQILSHNPDTGQNEPATVTHTHVHQNIPTLRVTTTTGPIITTGNHPIYTHEKGYIPARDLRAGDQLKTPDGTPAQILTIQNTGHHQTVHNLTIQQHHNYHVLAGNTPILVHNNGGCDDSILDADYFHYTDEASATSIARSGVIRTGEDGRVYLTDQMYSPSETYGSLFSGDPAYLNKGSYVIALKAPEGTELIVGSQKNEVFTLGSIRPDIVYAGINPFN